MERSAEDLMAIDESLQGFSQDVNREVTLDQNRAVCTERLLVTEPFQGPNTFLLRGKTKAFN
jgi:hypothetical protein